MRQSCRAKLLRFQILCGVIGSETNDWRESMRNKRMSRPTLRTKIPMTGSLCLNAAIQRIAKRATDADRRKLSNSISKVCAGLPTRLVNPCAAKYVRRTLKHIELRDRKGSILAVNWIRRIDETSAQRQG